MNGGKREDYRTDSTKKQIYSWKKQRLVSYQKLYINSVGYLRLHSVFLCHKNVMYAEYVMI